MPKKVDKGLNLFMAPGIPLTMWNPFMSAAADANTEVLGEFRTIAHEWQDFVARRLKEDSAFLERLTRSRTPDQILSAYADFWRKAGEDYGNEITTMTKLMTDMTSKMAVAAQSATEEANTKLSQREAS
jgi:hypothetical protein